jgi:hypothetical protein
VTLYYVIICCVVCIDDHGDELLPEWVNGDNEEGGDFRPPDWILQLRKLPDWLLSAEALPPWSATLNGRLLLLMSLELSYYRL